MTERTHDRSDESARNCQACYGANLNGMCPTCGADRDAWATKRLVEDEPWSET